jgi:predicted dehydrogenase
MTVGLGFIGAGQHALHLLREFSRLPEAAPLRITDPLEDRMRGAIEAFPGLEGAPSVEGLLSDPAVEAVVVATPAETHLSLARQVLESGRHLLLEKPMADSPAAARELVRLAAKSPGLVFMVAHGERFNKAYLDARRAIDEGHIGEPRFAAASRLSPLHLNNAEWKLGVMDTAVHDMDVMAWLLGDTPVEVTAQAVRVRPGFPIPDHATYQIRFERGGLAQGHIGWIDFRGGYPMDGNAHPRLLVVGTTGTIQLDLWQRPVAVYSEQRKRYFWADSVLVGYGDYPTQITEQNAAFLRAVRHPGRFPLPISPAEAARAVELAHAAATAIGEGRPVSLKIDS